MTRWGWDLPLDNAGFLVGFHTELLAVLLNHARCLVCFLHKRLNIILQVSVLGSASVSIAKCVCVWGGVGGEGV